MTFDSVPSDPLRRARLLAESGAASQAEGDFDLAIRCYRAALDLTPGGDRDLFDRLGHAYLYLGEDENAAAVWREWLAADPHDPVARHMTAAASQGPIPPRANDEYVRRTFDTFAATFDAQLARLDYRAPELIARVIAESRPADDGLLEILDAGCGTGLCAPHLRPLASTLTGVDLSPAMLAKARERGGYDALVQDELSRYLAHQPARFDAIAAADTLVYFGDLAGVLSAAASALRPDGLLIFTLEQCDQPAAPGGFALEFHGRYRHTEAYVREMLSLAELLPRGLDQVILRTERKAPAKGLLVSAAKPAR